MGIDLTYTSINPPLVFAAGMPVMMLGEGGWPNGEE